MPKEIKKTKAVKVKAVKSAKAKLVSKSGMPEVKLSINYTKKDYAVFVILLASFFALFISVSG